MKKTKVFYALLVSAMLGLVVVGCGSNETIDNGVGVENTTSIPTDSADLGDVVDSDNETSARTTNSVDCFFFEKLKRERTRTKSKGIQMDLLADSSKTEEQRNDAYDKILAQAEKIEIETATELSIEEKGFDDALVSIAEGSVDVVISVSAEVTDWQITQIEDIVIRKTGVSAEDIVISFVVTELFIEEKVFDGALVSIADGSVDAFISVPAGVTDEQAVQIREFVIRKTGASVEDIVFSFAVTKE